MVDISWFTAHKVSGDHDFPPPPPELLADLCDIVLKFGIDDPRVAIRRLSLAGERPVHVSVVSSEGNINTVVSSQGGGVFIGERCVAFLLSDPLPSGLVWDVGISLDDVRRFIATIDEEMRAVEGAFDEATGARLRSPRAAGVEFLISVDVYFKERGDLVVVPPGFDAEEYRALFDRPEALMVLTREDGINVLCRAQDGAYIMKRSEVIRQLLKVHHGIEDGDMSGLTHEQQVALLKQAFKILRRFEN